MKKIYLKKVKSQKGSATVLVTITVFTFIAILLGTYLTVAILRQSQNESNLRIQKVYMSELEKADAIYDDYIRKMQIPELWEETSSEDINWYRYGGVKVNQPKLVGGMIPIKYSKEQEENKWANAITKDGSMFVWIPRYAYKITEGYHTNTIGKIEIKFIDVDNNFLDGTKGKPETDPSKITYTLDANGNQVQDQWLVHPAFTKIADNGGGFTDSEDKNKELSGLWIGKFETTGSIDELTVKAGNKTLVDKTVNEMYKAGMLATFGESVSLQSHMLKNSEWGAVAYLSHSIYGTNREKVEQQIDTSGIAGGTTNVEALYEDENYKKHSTTYNAYGIYDLSGGVYEYVASYVYISGSSNLTNNGGITAGDLFGVNAKEQGTSTAYKTVYKAGTDNAQKSNYEANSGKKGDAIWETSNNFNANTGSWYGVRASIPDLSLPFFYRGGNNTDVNSGLFYFGSYYGNGYNYIGFRICLAV